MSPLQQWQAAVVQTAARLCQFGIRVFPCAPRTKTPPHGFYWKEWATNDINLFTQRLPNDAFNLALVLGPSSGIMDIEPDSEEASAVIDGLMREAGIQTMAYRSYRGVHRIFQWDSALTVLGTSKIVVDNLECRLGTDTRGNYSVCPPSAHEKDGVYYQWLPGCSPWETFPQQLPPNIRQYFLDNYKHRSTKAMPVSKEQDGYLPEAGSRHDYLLKTAMMLRVNQRLPSAVVKDMLRPLSQATGSYDEPGRGEVELNNAVDKLKLPALPEEEMTQIDFQASYALAAEMNAKYRNSEVEGSPEIPSTIFPGWIQTASEFARGSQLPRNMWLMTTLCAAAATMGAAVRVRASSDHPLSGLQLFSFGVGDSGSGKSRTLNSLLTPLSRSEAVITDATAESLQSNLAKFPRGVLLELSEGKDFTRMLGRYIQRDASTPVSDNSLYHKCWSGDRIRVIRQKESFTLDYPHLVVCAAIQKLNLNQIPASDVIDGLMQRMLVYPLGRTLKEPITHAMANLQQWSYDWAWAVQRLMNLKPFFGQVPDTGNGFPPEARPLILTLDDSASKLWRDYASYKRSDEVESMWPEEHPFRSDVLRHAEYVLRISACLMMLDLVGDGQKFDSYQLNLVDAGSVPEQYVRSAIQLMEWCWSHKQVLMDHLVETSYNKAMPAYSMGGETIQAGVVRQVSTRKKRIERRCGVQWTMRDYYRTLGLKRHAAEAEIAALIRDGLVFAIPTNDARHQQYKFVGEIETGEGI